MATQTNFGDPEFEPTDEDLEQLMREAFADVPRLRAEAQQAMRVRIAELRAEALERVARLGCVYPVTARREGSP